MGILICGKTWRSECPQCGNVAEGIAASRENAYEVSRAIAVSHAEEHQRAAKAEADRLTAEYRAERQANGLAKEQRKAARLLCQGPTLGSLLEIKGHMAELADGWMPEWVKVPT